MEKFFKRALRILRCIAVLLKRIVFTALMGTLLVFLLYFFFVYYSLRKPPQLTRTNLTSDSFWISDYDGKIPAELMVEGHLIAEYTEGFTDLVFMGLFELNQEQTKSLLIALDTSFTSNNINSRDSRYFETGICSGYSSLFKGEWRLDAVNSVSFDLFCSLPENHPKIFRRLHLDITDSEFEYINVIYYEDTNFFAIIHGAS